MTHTGSFPAKVVVLMTPEMKVKFTKHCRENDMSASEALRNCIRVVLREEEAISYTNKER